MCVRFGVYQFHGCQFHKPVSGEHWLHNYTYWRLVSNDSMCMMSEGMSECIKQVRKQAWTSQDRQGWHTEDRRISGDLCTTDGTGQLLRNSHHCRQHIPGLLDVIGTQSQRSPFHLLLLLPVTRDPPTDRIELKLLFSQAADSQQRSRRIGEYYFPPFPFPTPSSQVPRLHYLGKSHTYICTLLGVRITPSPGIVVPTSSYCQNRLKRGRTARRWVCRRTCACSRR